MIHVRLTFLAVIISSLSLATVGVGLAQSLNPPQTPSSRSVQTGSQPITWDTKAAELNGQLEQDFKVACPADGSIGSVWGTDIYTDDSSICSAAVHAGLITVSDGGTITLRIRPGLDTYTGTSRNGVTTNSYGSWSGSFIFLNSAGHPVVAELSTPTIGWSYDVTSLREQLNQDFTFRCPPNGSIGSVWGTDTYTDDSSICSAAVHAGLITISDGGTVKIRIRPGLDSYTGTSRNGVTTSSYGSWSGSFIFLK